MCKNFFLSPRSGICSERLFSPPSASGAPVCAVPCPRAAVLRPAAWVGRPRAGLLQGPVRPVGLRCLSGGRSHSATPPGAARPPAGLFVLKAVSGSPRSLRFHTRGAASPSAPPSASLAFSRAPALGELRAPAGASAAGHARLCLPGASLVPRCRAAFPAPSHPLCWLLPERFVSNACVNWRSAEVSLCGRCLAFAGRLMHTRTSRPPPAALRVFAVGERRPGSERVSARPWASVWNEEHLAPRARPATRLGRRLFQSRRRFWLQNKDSGPLPPFLPCGSLLCL